MWKKCYIWEFDETFLRQQVSKIEYQGFFLVLTRQSELIWNYVPIYFFPEFSFANYFQLDISMNSVTLNLQHDTDLNRGYTPLSWYDYDEMLIRRDLTCADTPGSEMSTPDGSRNKDAIWRDVSSASLALGEDKL